MKVLRTIFFSILFLLAFPTLAMASEVIKEVDGKKCFDLQAAYEEVNNTSKAITGQDQSVDALKKAQTLASLTNAISFFIGDGIYCVNDEVAASKTSSFEKTGLLGEIDGLNMGFLAYFPSVNVMDHLAETFVPGYKGNNSTYAGACEDCYGSCEANDGACRSACESGACADEDDNKAGVIEDKLEQGMGELMSEEEAAALVEAEIGDATASRSGYNYLKDYLHLDKIWAVSRNLAYLGFVVIVIIIGFMIMFRKNLPGQIVVSIGNSIPNVIIGLILVTFSFAIVGFAMDIGKVGINVVGSFFTDVYEAQDTGGEIIEIQSIGGMVDDAVGEAITPISEDASGNQNFISRIVNGLSITEGNAGASKRLLGGSTLLVTLLSMLRMSGEVDWISGIPFAEWVLKILEFAWDILVVGGGTVAILGALARNLLIILVCVYASIKLFITLFMTYFKLFLNVVLGPLQILIGSLPGNSKVISNWFKSVFANVLVFVAVFFLINIASYLARSIDTSQFNFFGSHGILWPEWVISFKGIFIIGGYLMASNVPGIINGMIGVEQNRDLASAGMALKQTASKIPGIGGLFGGK